MLFELHMRYSIIYVTYMTKSIFIICSSVCGGGIGGGGGAMCKKRNKKCVKKDLTCGSSESYKHPTY